MSNVSALPGAIVPTGEPNQALIAALEKILDGARSGELQSFFATGFRADGLPWRVLHRSCLSLPSRPTSSMS